MKTSELFENIVQSESLPVLKKSEPLRCLCCAFAIDTATPYPQLCSRCRPDMQSALVIVAMDCDDLEASWRDLMRSADVEQQQRFVAFLEAAGSAYGPAIYPTRQRAIAEFIKRADATVAKGGAFAQLVTAWRAWHRRCADRDLLQMMMVFRAEGTK